MSTEEQTAKEQQDALLKDPQVFWEKIHADTMEGIKAIEVKMQQDLGKGLIFYTNSFVMLIEFQSKELSIFRQMETLMRDESITEEQFKDCLSRLDGLRAEIHAKNDAMKEKQQQNQSQH